MYVKIYTSFLVLLLSAIIILYPNKVREFSKTISKYLPTDLLIRDVEGEFSSINDKLFEDRDLAKYHGGDNSLGLYIAILGSIYDVNRGNKHYGPGGTYHVFAGRDASRAFITGEFDSKLDLDHVLTLTHRDLVALNHWKGFYDKEYKYIGKLIGRFYDARGETTEYFKKVLNTIKEAEIENELLENKKLKYPSCNSEWSSDVGTRVWCTTKSGGIDRSWIGVPRKMYDSEKDHRCVCVQDTYEANENLGEYDCDKEATTCIIKNNIS